MLAEGVGTITGSPGNILLELELLAQGVACPDLLRLTPLLLPDDLGSRDHSLCLLNRHEQYTVGIGKDNVLTCDSETAELSGSQRLRMRRVKPLWSR